jgi:hypothetical protein
MTCFEWYDDESLIIAFTTGQVVNASVNPQTMGKELVSFRPSMTHIDAMLVN